MKIWILLLIAGMLLLWSFARERFEATQSIKAPPYDDGEKMRIYGMLSVSNQQQLMNKAKEDTPDETDEQKLKITAGGFVTPVLEAFFTTIFKPATVAPTEETVNTFMAGRTSDIAEPERNALIEYFINQSGSGTSGSSGYADALAALGQNQGYLQSTSAGATGATGSTGAPPPTSAGPAAGGTTGGSSDSSPAPNAGGVNGRQVFGPVFTSLAAPVPGGEGLDTSRTNRYPEVLGGMGDTRSVRGPGGIRNPSQNWLLSQSGALPSTASLGSDGNSAYLPYSRVPGDQDLIPDPYRLSRNYSTSSYSSKTDPVPFLTDFSAFFK